MIFALLLLQLVVYNAQGKHLLIKTEDDVVKDDATPFNEEGSFYFFISIYHPNIARIAKNCTGNAILVPLKWLIRVYMYSCPNLVVAKMEELISRPFVGQI